MKRKVLNIFTGLRKPSSINQLSSDKDATEVTDNDHNNRLMQTTTLLNMSSIDDMVTI